MAQVQVKQERMTYVDTITYQKRLMMFVRGKILGKPYFVDKKEMYDFYELVSYCFLSQGPFTGIVPMIRVQGRVVPLGVDVHHFANDLMFNVVSDRVNIRFNDKVYEVKSVELWKIFLKYCMILFPKAQAEALRMSKEVPKAIQRSAGFEFSSEKKLES